MPEPSIYILFCCARRPNQRKKTSDSKDIEILPATAKKKKSPPPPIICCLDNESQEQDLKSISNATKPQNIFYWIWYMLFRSQAKPTSTKKQEVKELEPTSNSRRLSYSISIINLQQMDEGNESPQQQSNIPTSAYLKMLANEEWDREVPYRMNRISSWFHHFEDQQQGISPHAHAMITGLLKQRSFNHMITSSYLSPTPSPPSSFTESEENEKDKNPELLFEDALSPKKIRRKSSAIIAIQEYIIN